MSDSLINIVINTVKRGGGDKEAVSGIRNLSKNFKELTGFSLGSMSAVGAAGLAIGGMSKFLKDAIGDTVEYATQVDNMSRLLGISTEDTSRLIQASDDLFISQEKLQAGLTAASRQGIDVSIEGLKTLSEEYMALPEGVERSQFALKKFGRSGAEMGKLMEIGAAGIDEATAAIAKNLVLTDKSMVDINNYKRSVDNLNDSWAGVKYTVGTKLVPELDLLFRAFVKGKDDIELHDDAVWKLTKQMESYAWAANLGDKSAKAAMVDLQGEIDTLNDEFYNSEDAAKTAETAIVGLGDNVSSVTQYFKSMNAEMLFNKLAANMTEDAAFKLASKMGLLDPLAYSLSLRMDELTAKYDTNRDGVIDVAESTADYYRDVMDLKGAVDSMKSKTISVTVMTNYSQGNIASAELYAGFDLNQNGVIGARNGLDMVVPTGYPKDSFPILAQSGERVQITPAGQNAGGNQITININGSGDPNAVANAVMRKLRLQGAAL